MYPQTLPEYDSKPMSQALKGLRIVEYGRLVSAPFCAKMMADLGAEVIKVEEPGGDDAREVGPFPGHVPHPEKSGLYLYLNSNKLGITLDLASPDGQAVFDRLISWTDVLIHNRTAAEADALGLRYGQLRPKNPRLIVTAITPFGLTGPYRGYKASDLISFHMGGIGYLTPRFAGTAEQEPLRPGGKQADFNAGMNAAIATMCALRYRDLTGEGQEVDVSEQETVMSMFNHYSAHFTYEGHVATRASRPYLAPYHFLRCKDGYVMLICPEEHHWRSMVELMGHPDWADDALFANSKARADLWEALEALIADWFLARTKDEIYRLAQERRIPLAPVSTTADLLQSPHLRARGYFVKAEHSEVGVLDYAGAPYVFSATPWRVSRPAPLLGQDNDHVVRNILGRNVAETKVSSEKVSSQVQAVASSGPAKHHLRRPLQGFRLVDFSTAWAGPGCTMLLADMGAEVIKVETIHRPDLTRRLRPWADGQPHIETSGCFANFCRGKKSLSLNLSSPEAIDLVKRLVAISDGVVENYSPRVMSKLGIPYAVLKEAKPDLVMISLSGYGATGPDRDYVSYGQNLEAFTGMDSLIGYPGGPPMAVGIAIADQVGGLMGAYALLAALRFRDVTGQGQYIDLSQCEGLSSLLPEAIMETAMNGEISAPMGNRDGRMAPHGLYPCLGEDEWIAIAVSDDEEWRCLCQTIGQPELALDRRFADRSSRLAHQEEIDPFVREWTTVHGSKDAMAILQKAGVPAGCCFKNRDLLEDPHVKARGFFVEIEHPLTGRRELAGLFAKLSGSPGAINGPAPLLGEHTDSILGDLLGLDAGEIDRLRDIGALS